MALTALSASNRAVIKELVQASSPVRCCALSIPLAGRVGSQADQGEDIQRRSGKYNVMSRLTGSPKAGADEGALVLPCDEVERLLVREPRREPVSQEEAGGLEAAV